MATINLVTTFLPLVDEKFTTESANPVDQQ